MLSWVSGYTWEAYNNLKGTGKKLGHICDIEFDECSGCICKIVIPGGSKMLSFLRCDPDIVIPYKDIRQIGPDIILVDINC